MIKQIYYSLILACSFLLSLPILSQTYPFVNFTDKNGLSQEQVLSVFQDENQIMWFGTNGEGITTFNGKTFDYLKKEQGLAGNFVYSILQITKSKILISTDNGLSAYNPKALKSNRFKNYTTVNGLNNNQTFCIIKDCNKKVLIGTAKGVSIFQDSICKPLNLDKVLDESSVFHIYEDSKHHLWFSTLGNGVFMYDGKTIIRYTEEQGLGHNMVFSVFEPEPNVFWFFTGQGLNELRDGKIIKINPANMDASTTYYSCLKDKQGVIWIGTGKGIIKYESGKTATVIDTNNGLIHDNIWKLFQDRENNLWFASNEYGLSKLSNELFVAYGVKDGLLMDGVKGLYKNKNESLWLSCKLGFAELKNDKVQQVFGEKKLKGQNIDCNEIVEDNLHNILVGTGNGLLVYDGKKVRAIETNKKSVDKDFNGVFSVLVDTKNTIWLGTQAGIAQVTNNTIEPFEKLKSIKSSVWKVYQSKKCIYWFGTDEGLYKYENDVLTHFTTKQGITENPIYGITEDIKGNLWLASSEGVFKYNGKQFLKINSLASDNVYAITIDKQGYVWAGLSNGLDRIKDENGIATVKHYNDGNGFMGKGCSQYGLTVDNDGKLWIGAVSGLVMYDPEKDKENKLAPITKLTSVLLMRDTANWSLYTDSIDYDDLPVNLKLPSNKNYLTFNFIGVTHTSPKNVTYQYTLKGFDKKIINTTETSISYGDLSPGDYEFLVKAQNGEGVWNKEFTSFKFTISPPWWRTWWAYSILGIIVVSFIYSYIRIRRANVKIVEQNRQIELSNVLLEKAHLEVEKKNRDITDSINYAKRIQDSFLTSKRVIDKCLPNHFITFKPRDIVSGDFYWAFNLSNETLVVCADCTGHGIPGAFMSLIGISLLNEITHSKHITSPAEILEELRRIIILALNPDHAENGAKDGMDITLISISKHEQFGKVKIKLAGANNSLYVKPKNSNEIIEYKGDKQPVAFYSEMKPFVEHKLFVEKGDTLYMTTDGYPDQFGGPKGKKFMSKQLKQLLIANSHLTMDEQKIALENMLDQWQGNLEQVDDITIMGIVL